MRHLSDQQIQDYLDRDPALDRPEVERHLSACATCRGSMAAYRQLYKGLGDETGFMLSANFADAVVARLEDGSEKKINVLEIGLLILGVICSLGAALYFSDIGKVFVDLFQQGSAGISRLAESVPILKSGHIYVLLFAAFILTAIGFLDKMLFQFRHR